jgi:NADPH:quinone reductase-like Zn-dependent oxidoreductase
MQIRNPAKLETLAHVDLADPPAPGVDEIQIRMFASSLNDHDYTVVTGVIPTADGRIPSSDGAGVVGAIDSAVADYAIGDPAVSTFSPYWLESPTRRSA